MPVRPRPLVFRTISRVPGPKKTPPVAATGGIEEDRLLGNPADIPAKTPVCPAALRPQVPLGLP